MVSSPGDKKKVNHPTASRLLEDGSLIELVYDPVIRKTALATGLEDTWTLEPYVDVSPTDRLVPFSPDNNLIKNDAVLLPSAPALYESDQRLISDVQAFIHRYSDLSETFERVAAAYVVLTWVYDAFNELPYLRLRGDFGTGKTRTLLTIGSLCHKAFFASGASTVSPIFHTLDAFQGTLIIDEADFRFSDERADIVKILNNGNVRGIPVLRTMMTRQREFNPQAFQVFGPKIVATRSHYEDKGLESRFLTEEMGGRRLRTDIPINLPPAFKHEAAVLRNQLLLYRFRNRHKTTLDVSLVDEALEPRLNQILLPLLSVVTDSEFRKELRAMAKEAQSALTSERALSVEAQLLEVLSELIASANRTSVPIAEITAAAVERYGSEYERPLTNRWVGGIVRKRLHVLTYKSRGVFVVPVTERGKIEMLCAKYGIDQSITVGEANTGDVGTSGT